MGDDTQPVVTPTPTDDEAAAIMIAIAHYLEGQRRAALAPAPAERRWALAGRLASQGQRIAQPPGTAITWASAARLARAH